MRIATWNVERLSPLKRLPGIMEELRRVDADVLVLTETDRRIHQIMNTRITRRSWRRT